MHEIPTWALDLKYPIYPEAITNKMLDEAYGKHGRVFAKFDAAYKHASHMRSMGVNAWVNRLVDGLDGARREIGWLVSHPRRER